MKKRHAQIAFVILVIVLVALVAIKVHRSLSASAVTTTTVASTVPALGANSVPLGSSTSTTAQSTVEAQSYNVGDCVTWDQSVTDAPPEVVSCKQTHIFEVDGQADMPPGKFPSAAEWKVLDSSGQCYALAIVYLGGLPTGSYAAASLDPTPSAWSNGQNYAWCGITTGGGTDNAFLPSVGSAKGSSKTLG